MSRIRKAETPYLRQGALDFGVGDTVDVAVKIPEGDKERIQVFSGVVIRRRGAGLAETFTVRRIVMGEGVERIFPVHSPRISSVKVLRRGTVRRAKLYYLRQRVGKATRLREIVGGEEALGAPEVASATPVVKAESEAKAKAKKADPRDKKKPAATKA
jgi:large subunit ribosomal protein L19